MKETALWFSSQTRGIQEPGHALARMCVNCPKAGWLKQGSKLVAVGRARSGSSGMTDRSVSGQVLQRGVSGERTVRVV